MSDKQLLTDFRTELKQLLNSHSKENTSNTPDLVLADYLQNCLSAFDIAVMEREQFYGRAQKPSVVDISDQACANPKENE